MNKEEVQQRVLQNGKPLALDKFEWDEKAKVFSTTECCLVLDFSDCDNCTFKTGSYCTFKTGYSCTFDAGSYCTFKTGDNCTFDTGYNCTFYITGNNSVIINRNVFEVITPKDKDLIQICPAGIRGHLVNGLYNNEPHIITDGILSKIVKQKGNVYHVINHGEAAQTYLIKEGEVYAHGKTLEDARESLVYKIAPKDLSAYENLTVDSVVTFAEAVAMYRALTGACASGCQYFVEQNKDKRKEQYTIAELVKLTEGAYNHGKLREFFNGKS